MYEYRLKQHRVIERKLRYSFDKEVTRVDTV